MTNAIESSTRSTRATRCARGLLLVSALALPLVALGCATSGFGSGQLTSPNEVATTTSGASRVNRPVQFAWRAESVPTRGTIEATLPDGRVFSGDFIQISSTSEGVELGPYWGGGWGPWGGYSTSGYARHYSGRVVSQLRGPNNQFMRCQFRLAVPEQGPQSGGQGECEVSTGERIDYAELNGQR